LLADLSGRILSMATSSTGLVDVAAPAGADGILVWKVRQSGAESVGETVMP
jgi:hypothetical protein